MKRVIWFDMDGTIADLYAVNNWLAYLQAESVYPYQAARTMLNFSQLAKLLHQLQRKGYQLGIISWTSKNGSASYNKAIGKTKLQWLKRHLPSVQWDIIHIVDYGTPKQLYRHTNNDILFDDEANNRLAWTGETHKPNEIFSVLKQLMLGA